MQIKLFLLAVTMALATLCMASDATIEKRNAVERLPSLGKRGLLSQSRSLPLRIARVLADALCVTLP
jgi:hypothetical protein